MMPVPDEIRSSSCRSTTIVSAPGAIAALLICAMWLLCLVGCGRDQSASERQSEHAAEPSSAGTAGFVTSATCLECHQQQHRSWYASYHRTMTTDPLPENIKAPFDGSEVVVDGRVCVPERDGEDFLVTLIHPEWEREMLARNEDPRRAEDPPTLTYHVDRVIGSHHQQVFLSRGPDGAYHTLPLVWDIIRERWITRKSSFLAPCGESLYHNTKLWNNGCIFCHNTGPQPGLVANHFGPGPAWRWESSVAELGIACEACHGPGAQHTEFQRSLAARNSSASESASDAHDSLILNPSKLPKEHAVLVCARCHGKMVAKAEFDRACLTEGDFFDPRNVNFPERYDHPELTDADTFDDAEQGAYFWSNGTPRTTALEYQGVLLSACYTQGEMTCFSCHSMHNPHEGEPDDQLRFAHGAGHSVSQQNQACTQCHEELSVPENLSAHSHHAADSAGSRCYDCHMPYQAYALHKRVRSHRITIPSVEESVRHGVPNACNQCHVDKSAAWTETALAEWTGRPAETSDLPTIPMMIEHALSGNALQRALAAEQLGDPSNFARSGTEWRVRVLTECLNDDYEAVRLLAFQSLQRIEGFGSVEFDFIAPEETRAARIEAIRRQADGRTEAAAKLAELLGVSTSEVDRTIREMLERQDKALIHINE